MSPHYSDQPAAKWERCRRTKQVVKFVSNLNYFLKQVATEEV